MTLDRGKLAKIDRRVLSGLDHNQSWQMVRVPASGAEWSAWKRYCDALGMSMGRAIAALIQNELRSVTDEMGDGPVFLAELESSITKRQRMLDARERNLEVRERRMRTATDLHFPSAAPGSRSAVAKVGRNDPCPCSSGLKYKRCHGG